MEKLPKAPRCLRNGTVEFSVECIETLLMLLWGSGGPAAQKIFGFSYAICGMNPMYNTTEIRLLFSLRSVRTSNHGTLYMPNLMANKQLKKIILKINNFVNLTIKI